MHFYWYFPELDKRLLPLRWHWIFSILHFMWHHIHAKLDWCALALFMCDIKIVLHPSISIFPTSHSVSLLTGSNAQCHIAQTHRNEIQQHIQMLIRLDAIKFIQIHCYGFRTTVAWSCSVISFMVSNSKCTTDHQEMIELWYFWCIWFYSIWFFVWFFYFIWRFFFFLPFSTVFCRGINRLQWTGSSITTTSRPIE